MASQYTMEYLKELQGYPLEIKIQLTKQRIREWVHRWGVDGVYVSFSGGKDSTVLLHIVREMYLDVPAVFVDTGLEYPEIRQFVMTFDNVEWLKPKKNFRQVIEDYGYPFPSKEVAQTVYEAKQRILKKGVAASYRLKKLNGEAIDKKTGKKSTYNIPQWKFLLDSPFMVSHLCCDNMKKSPAKEYEKKTGRKPITAQMASESRLRTQKWLQDGCNAFNAKRKISNPMSFWTEQDVLLYIYQNNIPIAPVYGKVVKEAEVEGQLDFEDLGIFALGRPTLKTTGCDRTGCMFCGFGCHLEKEGDGRFERLKITHPKIYDYIMRPWEQGGLNYKEVIDWINEHGDLHIRY